MKPSVQPSVIPSRLTRRTAVKISAVALAGLAAGSGLTAMITRITRHRPRPYRFFTEAEARLVIELCEQIIPKDDTAGATDAGVIYYLDRQLCGALARHQKTYRDGLDSFNKSCRQACQAAFEKLSAAKKISFLELVASGKAPGDSWPGASQKSFFELLVDHTMQGFYGSPRHGGNRDYVSYKMLKLDYPQIIGQNRYPGKTS